MKDKKDGDESGKTKDDKSNKSDAGKDKDDEAPKKSVDDRVEALEKTVAEIRED